jgi:hypothetical protein
MYLDFDTMSNAGNSSMPGVSMDGLERWNYYKHSLSSSITGGKLAK